MNIFKTALRRPRNFALIAGTMILLSVANMHAQTVTGRLVGTVMDASSAVIPEASVTVTARDTGYKWNYTTDGSGRYMAPSLPPGTFQIRVEAKGFRSAVASDNVVNVAGTTRVDFTLQIGAVSDSIEVQAVAPLVRSTTSEMGETIEMRQLQVMPLNGRIFSQLVQLTPGTVAMGATDSAESPSAAGARSATESSVNGLPWSGTTYTIDGVSSREPQNANITIAPPLEAIAEVKVQTNNPGAEFGAFGGAAVTVSMRSGTNEFHGSLFEYLRNDAMNARSFFAVTKAPFKTNQFGGTIGGPIIRNKAFFFGDYQALRLRKGSTNTLNVPTANMINGNFTAAEGFGTIYDPDNAATPFPNNQVPSTRWDAVAAKARSIWPAANQPGTFSNGPSANFQENTSQSQTVNQFDVKGDYQASDRGRFFVRESYAKRFLLNPAPGNKFMGQENSDSRNHNAVIGYTHTFSSNLLSESRLGFNRFYVFHYGNDYGIDENNILGIPNGNLPAFPESSGVANFGISGIQGTGAPASSNAERLSTTYQIVQSMTWTKAAHTIKMGLDIGRVNSTVTNPEANPRGAFAFDNSFTSKNGSGGAAFASFLLGYTNSITRGIVNTKPDVMVYNYSGFVQDDWRVSRLLTLNVGLRYDIATTPRERHNRQTNFNLQDGLMHLATSDNHGPNVDTYMGGLAPRVGLAYSPDGGRTAIRSAFGLTYFPDNYGANGGTLERNFPLFQTYTVSKQQTYVPFAKMSVDGLPGVVPIPLAPTVKPITGATPIVVSQNFQPDSAYMWNVGIQRQLTASAVLEAAYVGTHGSHLFRDRSNINVPLPGPGTVDPRRPYYSIAPQVQNIRLRSTDGDSSYNALQVKFTKRLSAGLQGLLSYTWAKSIDDMNIFWPYDDKLNRGVSNSKALDLRHVVVASYTYNLPVGKGKKLLSGASPIVESLLGEWSLNGITTLRTGEPLVLGVATSLLNNTLGNRANINCDGVGMPKTVDKWFDISCFSAPAQYVFGNSGKGNVRGPGVINQDFSLFKSFRIAEKKSLEFRAEAFNLTNTPHFSNPGTTQGNSGFGKITGTNLTPREVQLALKLTF